ncbi:MAG: hypothetical protein RI985_1305 [Chloroflexota bacterium]|jgi:hypothetical protein
MQITRVLLVFISCFVVIACSSTPATTIEVPPAQPGLALMRGRMQDPQGSALANWSVRLAPIYGSGDQQAYVLDEAGGIGGVTNENGEFAITNIPPGRYVILLIVEEGLSIAMLEPNGTEKVVELAADKLTDIGTARITIPGR